MVLIGKKKISSEKYLLQAKIAIIQEQPAQAIVKLSNIHNISQLPNYYQILVQGVFTC